MARSLSESELGALQASMVEEWNRPSARRRRKTTGAMAVAQALPPEDPPRPGFAVGQSVDPKTGERWLEVRVRTDEGSEFTRAQRLVKKVQKAGAKINLRVVPMPHVSVGKAQDAGINPKDPPVFGVRAEPLHVGCSIGHEDGFAGSLAAFVRMPGNATGALSCCHVLALCGGAKQGTFVHQPGSPDEDPPLASGRVGVLSGTFAPFRSSARRNLDAAVAELLGERGPFVNILPDCATIPVDYRGEPFGPVFPAAELTAGTRVGRVGRTTGFAEGIVIARQLDNFKIDFGGPRAGEYAFDGIIEIEWTPPSRGGDSGSLVFVLPELRPLGLHMAGEGALGYAAPIDRICAAYRIELL